MADEDTTPAAAPETPDAPAVDGEAPETPATPAEGAEAAAGGEEQGKDEEGKEKAEKPAKKSPDWRALDRRVGQVQRREQEADRREAETKTQMAQLQPVLREHQAFKQREALKEKDPIAYFEACGFTVEQLVELANGRYLKDSSPDAETRKAREEAAAARRELEEFKTTLSQREKQQAIDRTNAEMSAFVAQAHPETKAPMFPAASTFERVYGREELLEAAHGIARRIRQAGTEPTYDSVAVELEKRTTAFLAQRGIPTSGHGGPSNTSSPLAGQGQSQSAKPSAKTPTTLTNGIGSESTGREREMTQAERDRESERILREMAAKRKAKRKD